MIVFDDKLETAYSDHYHVYLDLGWLDLYSPRETGFHFLKFISHWEISNLVSNLFIHKNS